MKSSAFFVTLISCIASLVACQPVKHTPHAPAPADPQPLTQSMTPNTHTSSQLGQLQLSQLDQLDANDDLSTLNNSRWQLISVTDQTGQAVDLPLLKHQPTISIDNDQVQITNGCNNPIGQINWAKRTASHFISTRMACDTPLMVIDTQTAQLLGGVWQLYTHLQQKLLVIDFDNKRYYFSPIAF